MKSFLVLFLLSTQIIYAAEIPSCMDMVMDKPGASEICSPPIISNKEAFEGIQLTKIKKIGYNWFLLGTREQWKKVSTKMIWQNLIISIMSIQSLYGENVDVYFVILPLSKADFLGVIPQEKIKAVAKYKTPENLFGNGDNTFPKNHHKRLYTLIVFPNPQKGWKIVSGI